MELLVYSYLLLFFIFAIGLFYVGRYIEKAIDRSRHGWVRMLVIIPQGLMNPLAVHKPHEINRSTELYERLGELRIPFVVEVAVHGIGEEVHFYVCTPRIFAKKTARLIESLWNESYITDAEEYELWLAGSPENSGHIAAGYLAQSKPYCLPLKTAIKGGFEPFSGVLRHLSDLAAIGEGASIQWLVQPADPRLVNDVGSHLKKLEHGAYHPSRHVHENFVLTPDTIKSLEEKVSTPLFAVNCRIVTTATTGNAHEILNHIGSHIEQSSQSGTQHNSLKLVEPKQFDRLLNAFLSRRFEASQEMILNANELATYVHLPGPTTTAPKLKR